MDQSHQQYTCPMHPEVIKDAPGQCPKCGMNLVPVKNETANTKHEHGSHDQSVHGKHGHDMAAHDHKSAGGHAHHAGMIDDFKRRFYVVLILTIPIMALSPMIQHWLKVDWSFQGSNYVLLIL
jgi:P-type Cu2+ transporter